MNINNVMTRCVAVVLLLGITPLSNAWNLVSKANSDPHNIAWGFISVSGSGSAFNNGVPNQYAGNVNCGTGYSQCRFGPMVLSVPGSYFPMGCEPVSGGGAQCYNNAETGVVVRSGIPWDEAISLWHGFFGGTVFRQNAYAYYDISKSLCTLWGNYSMANIHIVPGTMSCGGIPSIPNQCTVSGGAVDLNHGLLNTGEITGKKIEVIRQVSCTRGTSIKYTVSHGNPVDLGNGINSSITVNGIAAGQLITLPGGSSSLRIASTLTDKGATPGTFSKAVVLIQSFL